MILPRPGRPQPRGPTQQGWTRGLPVLTCVAAPSWGKRAPLGAGDAWGLGIGSAGDLPSRLGLWLA